MYTYGQYIILLLLFTIAFYAPLLYLVHKKIQENKKNASKVTNDLFGDLFMLQVLFIAFAIQVVLSFWFASILSSRQLSPMICAPLAMPIIGVVIGVGIALF